MTTRPSAALAQSFSNVGHSCSHILTLLYPTVVLALEREWGMSYGELITLMLVGQVLFGAAALPAGWMGDRWSALGMMVLFFVGTGGSAVLTGLARNPLEMLAGLALIGLFGSIYHPVGLAWLIRNAVRRGRALGTNGMFGAIGVALGPLIAGVLTDAISWRAAFIIPGAAAFVLGVALWICWRLGLVEETRVDAKPQPEPSRATAIRAFIVLSVTMVCVGLIGQTLMVVLPKLFEERLSDIASGSASLVGLLVTSAYLCAAGAQYVGGILADRFPLKHLYLSGFALQAPFLFLAAVLESWPLLLTAMAMVFVNTGATASENGLLALYTPGKWRATAYGAKFVLALGVSAGAIPLAGYVHDQTGGFFWLFVALGVAAAIVVAAGSLLPSERPKVAVPAAPQPVAAE